MTRGVTRGVTLIRQVFGDVPEYQRVVLSKIYVKGNVYRCLTDLCFCLKEGVDHPRHQVYFELQPGKVLQKCFKSKAHSDERVR